LSQDDPRLIVAVAAMIDARQSARRGAVNGHASASSKRVGVVGVRDGVEYALEVTLDGDSYDVEVNGERFLVQGDWRPGSPLFEGNVNGSAVCIQVERRGTRYRLSHAGGQIDILIVREHVAALNRLMPFKEPPDMSRFLLSPMPGLLVRLAVAAGDAVKAGEELATVEAMKMENVLRAEQDGTVKELLAGEGDSLMVDQPILAFTG